MRTTLEETVRLMCSEDYKDRFVAEYTQLKVRYEKLKAFNNQIEAAERTHFSLPEKVIETPKHDCPPNLLSEQQTLMGNLLHVLEVRAVIEKIDLPEVTI